MFCCHFHHSQARTAPQVIESFRRQEATVPHARAELAPTLQLAIHPLLGSIPLLEAPERIHLQTGVPRVEVGGEQIRVLALRGPELAFFCRSVRGVALGYGLSQYGVGSAEKDQSEVVGFVQVCQDPVPEVRGESEERWQHFLGGGRC